ncbi:3-hydroxyacyl-ACP dehydratase FabZ family protein [Allorhodopirellula solitaria]|uniref:3-hydroxyacyl-[acyl-carrier-protein] dehydratase FabZ n=1 Tax=Allorhodopirellula solitaria TaxID=2527987 RepID=A0A5C5XZT4_9BACT|nr:3-hydroxyacyl-ACP dehydratase FabZ family protein [Allorhodopirellula solitaria]TWT67465.1 3-hydroxyacyl-[acyl-carrier-protein] dehydratase FabZ [Allorhodopirellula solitaria]
MKYSQLDRITLLEPGQRLVGERTLNADEEYLQDHFPRFPVMPGVMMLEALHQAAAWLIRMTPEFDEALVLLREVRNVKFGDFLSPGETLTVEAEIFKVNGPLTTIKAVARKGDRTTVAARLILESCSSGDPEHLDTDDDLKRLAREQFFQLYGDCPCVAALRRPGEKSTPTMTP